MVKHLTLQLFSCHAVLKAQSYFMMKHAGQKVLNWGTRFSATMYGSGNLSLRSYNLRGFNNGLPYLKKLCSDNDIIFVQEHWLLKSQLYMLDNIKDNRMLHHWFYTRGCPSTHRLTERWLICFCMCVWGHVSVFLFLFFYVLTASILIKFGTLVKVLQTFSAP